MCHFVCLSVCIYFLTVGQMSVCQSIPPSVCFTVCVVVFQCHHVNHVFVSLLRALSVLFWGVSFTIGRTVASCEEPRTQFYQIYIIRCSLNTSVFSTILAELQKRHKT